MKKNYICVLAIAGLLITSCSGSDDSDTLDPALVNIDAPMVTSINASKDQTASVTITWPAVNGATFYNVFRREGRHTTSKLIGSTTATTYTDTTINRSFRYYYQVQVHHELEGYSLPYPEDSTIKIDPNSIGYTLKTADDWRQFEDNYYPGSRGNPGGLEYSHGEVIWDTVMQKYRIVIIGGYDGRNLENWQEYGIPSGRKNYYTYGFSPEESEIGWMSDNPAWKSDGAWGSGVTSDPRLNIGTRSRLMYVIGGRIGNTTASNKIWGTFSTLTWTNYAILPKALFALEARYHDNYIYIWGGIETPSFACNKKLYRYDPLTNLVVEMTTTGTAPRSLGMSMVEFNGSLYIIGGGDPTYNSQGRLTGYTCDSNNVTRLDITGTTCNFTQVGDDLPNTVYVKAVEHNGRLYAIGGMSGSLSTIPATNNVRLQFKGCHTDPDALDILKLQTTTNLKDYLPTPYNTITVSGATIPTGTTLSDITDTGNFITISNPATAFFGNEEDIFLEYVLGNYIPSSSYSKIWSSSDGITWTEELLPAEYRGRESCTAVSYNGHLYVFSGYHAATTAEDQRVVSGYQGYYLGDIWYK